MSKLIARLDRQECEDGDINVLEAINMTGYSDLIKTYCEIKKIQPISFDQYLDIDCKEITSAPLSDKEIVEMYQEGGEVDEIREEEVVTTSSPVIDFKTALIYIDSIKHLFNSMNAFDEVYSQAINTIEHLDDIIVQQRLNNEFKERKLDHPIFIQKSSNLDDFLYKH